MTKPADPLTPEQVLYVVNRVFAVLSETAQSTEQSTVSTKPGRKPREAIAESSEVVEPGKMKNASHQLQGRYLGLIRQIPATRRVQFKKTAASKGREAAIKEMQKYLKK